MCACSTRGLIWNDECTQAHMSVYQSDRQTVGKRVGMKKIPDKEMSESVHENVFRIPD